MCVCFWFQWAYEIYLKMVKRRTRKLLIRAVLRIRILVRFVNLQEMSFIRSETQQYTRVGAFADTNLAHWASAQTH